MNKAMNLERKEEKKLNVSEATRYSVYGIDSFIRKKLLEVKWLRVVGEFERESRSYVHFQTLLYSWETDFRLIDDSRLIDDCR